MVRPLHFLRDAKSDKLDFQSLDRPSTKPELRSGGVTPAQKSTTLERLQKNAVASVLQRNGFS
jgi:hypothetical protein